MYSDFYEIPLPGLRFEKVEENDTKKWKRHQRETTPSKARQNQEAQKRETTLNDAQRKADSLARQSQEAQRENDANDAQRKAESLARRRHAKRLKNASKTKAFVIREIKLTHRKNGH